MGRGSPRLPVYPMQYHHQREELSREGTIFNARSRSQLKFNGSIVSIGNRTIVKKLTFYVPQKSGERSSRDAGSFGGFGRRRNELLSLIFIVYLFLFFFLIIVELLSTLILYDIYVQCIFTKNTSVHAYIQILNPCLQRLIYIYKYMKTYDIYIHTYIFTYLSIPKEEERYLNYFIF